MDMKLTHPDKPLLGVSACLAGRPVRFNGGHCRARFLVDELSKFADLLTVCPEIEIGLGAPRDTLRLVRIGETDRLINPKSGQDLTEQMESYARAKVDELAESGLSGFVLKKDSPSCGMERVKTYDSNNVPAKAGVGIFARALLERMPLLPVEEEGRLNDFRLRENFLERVFAYQRLRRFFGGDWTLGDLVAFHTAEKLLLMSHDPAAHARLGQLVAAAKGRSPEATAREYSQEFMRALTRQATVRRQVNVLQRMVGYFKGDLVPEDKLELRSVIDDFRAGLTPLATPLTLIRHYVRRFEVSYIAGQTYLDPHPKELRLRSFV